MYASMRLSARVYLSRNKDLLQQPVVVLLNREHLPFSLRFCTQLPVFDHLRIEVTICEDDRMTDTTVSFSHFSAMCCQVNSQTIRTHL